MSEPIPVNGDMYTRVGRLEASVTALHGEVGKLDQGQTEIKAAILAMSDKMGSSGRTNWGVLIAAAGLTFAIGGAVLTAAVLPLRVMDEVHDREISELRAQMRADHDYVVRLQEREQIRREMGK